MEGGQYTAGANQHSQQAAEHNHDGKREDKTNQDEWMKQAVGEEVADLADNPDCLIFEAAVGRVEADVTFLPGLPTQVAELMAALAFDVIAALGLLYNSSTKVALAVVQACRKPQDVVLVAFATVRC